MKRVITYCMAVAVVLTTNAVAEFNFDKAPKKLTAYYLAGMQTVDILKNKLISNGFEVLATDKVLEGSTVITITNDELKKTNSYMATLHILVNSKENEVRVQNPSYLGLAYLKGYKYGDFKSTLNALEKVLSTMIPVLQQKEFSALPKYHFMFGMPYLEDKMTIAEGSNLLAKITAPNVSKYISYRLKLPNGNTLVGHKFNSDINKFLKKINQTQNAQLLPYESMVESDKATILDPKYYLALSLPLLSMSEFMKIATTPNAIEREISKAYK